RPYDAPSSPLAAFLAPKIFHPGTGPSSTRATGRGPLTASAANMHGALKTSGRFRIETWENAPVPSRQIIPAPIPPIGKATRLSLEPSYTPLYRDSRVAVCCGEAISAANGWGRVKAPALVALPMAPRVVADRWMNSRRPTDEWSMWDVSWMGE